MRRISLILLVVALAAPALAFAGSRASSSRASSAGTLVVDGASGTVFIQGKGVIYGSLDQGKLLVLHYKPDEVGSAPSVTSPKVRFARGAASFAAKNVRFLFPSGTYTLELIATGIDISAIGSGSVVATSASAPSTTTPAGSSLTVSGTAAPTTSASSTSTTSQPAIGSPQIGSVPVLNANGTIAVNGGKAVPLTKGSTIESFGPAVKLPTVEGKTATTATTEPLTTVTTTTTSKSSGLSLSGGK